MSERPPAVGLEVLRPAGGGAGGAWKEYKVHRRNKLSTAWFLSPQLAIAALPPAVALAHWKTVPIILQVLGWALAAVLAWSWASVVQSESVVVVDGLGVQLTARSRMGCRYGCLLETERLKDVIIYEVISAARVHTFLAFLLIDTSTLVIAYKVLEPRLEILQAVYRDLKADLCPKPRTVGDFSSVC